MNYDNLSSELKEKAKACTNETELVELAKSEGIELTDSELEAVAGGESAWDAITGCDGQACRDHNCSDFCSQCIAY